MGLIQPVRNEAEVKGSMPRTLLNILSAHASRYYSSHNELVNLHNNGIRYMRTVYLEDGTMLSDMGGSTLVIHPDNRLAVVFNHNADKVRRVHERDGQKLKRPGLADTEGLIVIDARECDKEGLTKSWVTDAVNGHNALISQSNAFHGILKNTAENEWRSESISYDIREPRKKKNGAPSNDNHTALLSCGYGAGLLADTVADHEKVQLWLWHLRKRITRDTIRIKKSDVYSTMFDHFSTIAPNVLQGDSPQKVTFKDGLETEFSKAVLKRNEGKSWLEKKLGLLRHKCFLLLTSSLGVGLLLGSGVVKTIKMTALKNIAKSLPGAAWQFLSRKGMAMVPAAGVAVGFLTLYFLSNTIAQAKQQFIWTLKDKEDRSASFYGQAKNSKNSARRYQEADPRQMAECMALNVFEYDCVPADVDVFREEPEEYILNRLFSTKSVREGSLMQAFKLNAQKVTYYDESHGIRRVVIPNLRTAFVTYVHSKEGELEISQKQKAILQESEVIKIVEDPITRKLSHKPMTYEEYEEDLVKITQVSNNNSLCLHPDNKEYMARMAESAKNSKIIYRIKGKMNFVPMGLDA